jgi:hypothetical protein
MQATDEILARVEREIGAGRIWRAKEILRGALVNRAEPELLQRYGRLLEAIGERYEAGKYLFLSGARAPEHRDAIQLFLTRNSERRDADFIHLFPAAVRRLPFEQLPEPVQQELHARGVRRERFSGAGRIVPPVHYTLADRLKIAFAVLIGVLFVVALGLGLRQIVNWLWRAVSN